MGTLAKSGTCETSAAADPTTSRSSHLLGGVFLGVSARNGNQNSLLNQ